MKYKCCYSFTDEWIIKANTSNEIILGLNYSLVVACYEDSQRYDDRQAIKTDVRFTNTSTSKCYNYLLASNHNAMPKATPLLTVSTFISPKVKEATQLSLSTHWTKVTILPSSTPTYKMPNNPQPTFTVFRSLVPSSHSTSR